MKIIVSGLFNIEMNTKINSFPIPYEPVRFNFFGVQMGISGVGYNVMMALHTLGAQVVPVTIIGTDLAGDIICRVLSEKGIERIHVHQTLSETPMSSILFDSSGRRRIECDLKDIQEKYITERWEEDPLEKADGLIAGTVNFSRNFLQSALEKKIPIFVDCHVLSDVDDAYHQDFLNAADVLFLSDEKIPLASFEFLKLLKNRTKASIIVIGEGEKGASIFVRSENSFTHQKAFLNPNTVNTIGAGDALFSSFVYFFLKTANPHESLRKAQFFASKKIEFSGGSKGFLTENELDEIIVLER